MVSFWVYITKQLAEKRNILFEIIFCFFVFILLLPTNLVYEDSFLGLDPSWSIGLNIANEKNLYFGKDIIFTYGPMAFLYTKNAVYHSKYLILLFEIIVSIFIYLIIKEEEKKFNNKKLYSFLVLLTLLFLRMPNMVFWLPILVIYFLIKYLSLQEVRLLYLAVFVCIINFYIKTNYGLVFSIITFLYLVYQLFINKLSVKHFLILNSLQLACHLIFSCTLNVSFLSYVYSSLYIINDYNDAMYFHPPGLNFRFLFALILILSYLTLTFHTLIKNKFNRIEITTVFLTLVYLFLIWKNGFVRADSGHKHEFFRLVIIPFLLLFFSDGTKSKWKYGFIYCVIFPVNSFFLFTAFSCGISATSIANIFKFEYLKEVFESNEDVNKKFNHKNYINYINDNQKKEIDSNSVDILPWEISNIFYNNLNYKPRPIFQSYSAYGYYLDSLNYIKYYSEDSPKYLLFSNISIDNRLSFWDESITKRAILSRYELISSEIENTEKIFSILKTCNPNSIHVLSTPQKMLKSSFDSLLKIQAPNCYQELKEMNVQEHLSLLLKKRKKTLAYKTKFIRHFDLKMGNKLLIDNSNELQYMYANVNYSLLGKLMRFFYQPPPLLIEIETENGELLKFRAITSILKTGVLINKEVLNTYDAAMLFAYKGQKNKNIQSIRFIGGTFFENNITLNIKHIEY